VVPKVEVAVLGLLAEEPLYGYELLDRFGDRAMDLWVEVGRASVYQALGRLEAAGFVTGRAQEGREGPDRRVFRIARAGRDRLRAGLFERFGAPDEREAALALGFAHLLSVADGRTGLASREAALETYRASIAAERERLADAGGPAVSLSMLDRQDALARAELAWLATFRRELAKARR
jgi:DNA-binding PadR family transcriptional regulator